MACKKKRSYIVATPKGRSVISRSKDPNKAFHDTKADASKFLRFAQKDFRVKLKVKKVCR